MRDEIFWGNLIGLLKTGKWTLGALEAQAFSAVYEECLRRSQPVKPEIMKEPIKASSPKKVVDANK
jgi:hypothetical protein